MHLRCAGADGARSNVSDDHEALNGAAPAGGSVCAAVSEKAFCPIWVEPLRRNPGRKSTRRSTKREVQSNHDFMSLLANCGWKRLALFSCCLCLESQAPCSAPRCHLLCATESSAPANRKNTVFSLNAKPAATDSAAKGGSASIAARTRFQTRRNPPASRAAPGT